MNDPEVMEHWLIHAFAPVKAPPGVDAWHDLATRRTSRRNTRRKLMDGLRPRLTEMGLTAGIVAVLFMVSIAGTLALTHSHASPPATVHSSSAPAATHSASPTAKAAASACSRLQAAYSLYGFRFDPPGSAEPAISCSRAIATLLCSPHFGNAPCFVLHGLPVKAELVRISHVGPMGEVRGHGLPFVGPPFVPSNLLVWQLTWVPTVCIVDGNSVSGSDLASFSLFFTPVSARCRASYNYLIDASTGNFVFYDGAIGKAG
jgi:hypothetical protein